MQDLRQRIVAETYAQLLSGGIRHTRVDQLARALHISKKTLYRCFPSKAALLQAVFRWWQQRAWVQCQAFQRAPTAPAELKLLQQWLRAQCLALPCGFLGEMRRAAPELWQASQQYLANDLLAVINRNLHRGQVEGTYRVLDAEVLSQLYLALLSLVLDGQLAVPGVPMTQVYLAVDDHFLSGLLHPD